MNVKEYLEIVANVVDSDLPKDSGQIYVSKHDGSYITRVGMEDTARHLADNEVTEELTHGVGFSPSQQKWYGWSHRAMYGFGVGSTCEKGDIHYVPDTLENLIEDTVNFWRDEKFHERTWIDEESPGLYHIKWLYNDKVPSELLRGTVKGHLLEFSPDLLGRGEWTAETLEDAKQMAIDFNKGVS